MFDMPLATSIEICHTKDVGLALANSVDKLEIRGQIMHIAGGEKCRTLYKNYLSTMFEKFGLGKNFLPAKAFNKGKFHCGFLETEQSQKTLQYQRHTLKDYYEEVKNKVKHKRPFFACIKPFIRSYLLKKSPHY